MIDARNRMVFDMLSHGIPREALMVGPHWEAKVMESAFAQYADFMWEDEGK